MNFIRYFDYLSDEVKLTIGKGQTRRKTVLGGILSIISVLTTVAFGLYFFIQLLNKESSYVIGSTKISPFYTINHSNEFPFLIRLTDEFSVPYEHPERLYSIKLQYWVIQSSEMQQEESYDIELEQCEINKHFGIYTPLFNNLTDLDSFYCARLRPDNYTIKGRYGDVQPFHFYQFYISMCSGRDDCYDNKTMMEMTETIYLDFRTVDFGIDNYNSNPKIETIHSSRHMLSSTIFKRIWFYLSGIEYTTDSGFFFPSLHDEVFSRIDSTRYDSDIRNIHTGFFPGTFSSMTIIATGTNFIYFREYTKIQTYLASIGGIINFIQIVAVILNYTYSYNSYYFTLISDLVVHQVFQRNLLFKSGNIGNNTIMVLNKTNRDFIFNANANNNAGAGPSSNANPNSSFKDPGYGLNNNNNLMNDSRYPMYRPKTIKEQQQHKTIIDKMKLSKYKIFPLVISPQREAKSFLRIIERVNSYLNVSTMLTKLEEAYIFSKQIIVNENYLQQHRKLMMTKNSANPQDKTIMESDNRATDYFSLNQLNKKSTYCHQTRLENTFKDSRSNDNTIINHHPNYNNNNNNNNNSNNKQ